MADAAGVPIGRVGVDARAVDTLSNFTTVAPDLARLGCRRVVVSTSETHMRRAFPLGAVVLGAHGMAVRRLSCGDASGDRLSHVLLVWKWSTVLHRFSSPLCTRACLN
jgi:hypothetical protein